MLKKIILFLLIVSCNETKTTVVDNYCNRVDIVCTEQFETITVEIVDKNNTSISLDRFEVIRKDTGKDISNKQNIFENYYPVVDDGYQSELENNTQTFTFMGYKNKKKVVSETYVVTADCCHIMLVSGKTKIILP